METAGTTDEQIVKQALAHDPDAFGELVRRWERRIFALTYGILGREEDARDATQETFIAAYRNLSGFRGEAKVSSWLHRIAVNQCITRQRRAKVRGETSLEGATEDYGAQFAAPVHESPARIVEGRERSVAVRRAGAARPPEWREGWLMRGVEAWTFQEIVGTVDVALRTGKSGVY